MALYKKNYISFIVLFCLFLVANLFLDKISFIAVLYMAYIIINNKMEDILGLILFLLPCIRILDVSNYSSLLNLIFLFAGVKYVFIERRKRLDKYAIIVTMFFAVYEGVHLLIYENMKFFSNELFSGINIIFNIFVLVTVVNDRYISLEDKMGHYVDALMYGVFTSTIAYVASNGFGVILAMIKGSTRLYAYGNDPNYFCMYILLVIFGKQVVGKNRIIDVIEIIVLVFLVFLTSSKMGLLCIAFYGCYLLVTSIYNSSNRKVFSRFLLFGLLVIYFMREEVVMLFNKVIMRFTYGNAQATLNTISSGRFDIVKDYLFVITNTPSKMVLGYGLEYNRVFGKLVAHNTFLDIFLSWGIIGSIAVVSICLAFMIKEYSKFTKSAIILLIVFMFMLCALSCFTSDMFWYLLIYVVGALRVNNRTEIGE